MWKVRGGQFDLGSTNRLKPPKHSHSINNASTSVSTLSETVFCSALFFEHQYHERYHGFYSNTRLALATGTGCSSRIKQTPSAAALFVVVAEQ